MNIPRADARPRRRFWLASSSCAAARIRESKGTIPMLIDRLLTTADGPGRDATLADPTRCMTFADLARFADVMRRQIEKITSNPHVGIMMPSTCAFAGTFFGALWARRTVVPLNFLLQPAELSAVVADAGLDTIFSIRHFADQLAAVPAKKVFVEDLPLMREMVMQRIRSTPPAPPVSRDDVAILLYTSGTSGVPKGVCQTYGNLISDMDACIEMARLRPGHRFLGVLPLFHSFGLTAMLLVPATLGASVYYLPRFTPAGLIDVIREQKSSVTMMIASTYAAMLKAKKGGRADLASIEYAISGGEALKDSVFHQFRERFGVEILQGYGMTEAAPVVSLNVPWAHRIGTVGRAIPGIEARVFDDAGAMLPPEKDGELWVRGPIVMKGYYKKESETRQVITPEGWYRTGDMATVDGDGFIRITGRKKEMIIVGGENVYPREVEAALEQHPAVAEAAVIGQHDPSRGEIVVAFVTLRESGSTQGSGLAPPDENELRTHCRERVAGYKVPRRVIISQDLPRGPTGKILKRRLAELL